MRSIRDIPLHHQTVFLRVDFNVPLHEVNGKIEIADDTRIKAALPTIEYIIQKGGRLVIGSHLGRPDGKVEPSMRLQPIAERLHQLLGQNIVYVDDCIGTEVERLKAALKPGDIMLLENLRFYTQEEDNDIHFAEQLAQGIDVYITDAFGAIHRKHASTYALPSLIFDRGVGFLIEREIDALNKIIDQPEKPLVIMVGGVKISDKVDVIRHLAPLADVVLLGGGVANTFLQGLGYDIGASKQESADYGDVAKDIWNRFASEDAGMDIESVHALKKIVLPVDVIAAPNTNEGAETKIIVLGKDPVPRGWMFLDIGPQTRDLYGRVLAQAKTIFWNGPLGLFEMEAYAVGSRAMAETIANSGGYAVLGGGDTERVVEQFELRGHFAHTSTGGGASLKYLTQKGLPGLDVLA